MVLRFAVRDGKDGNDVERHQRRCPQRHEGGDLFMPDSKHESANRNARKDQHPLWGDGLGVSRANGYSRAGPDMPSADMSSAEADFHKG